MRSGERSHAIALIGYLLSATPMFGSPALAGAVGEAAATRPAPLQAQDPAEAKRFVALGDSYARARGAEKDDAKAATLYAQAAALGDPSGMLRYGEALVYGRGVKVDRARGISLVEGSVRAGNSAAMVSLSDMVAKGLAGQEGRQRAVGLLEQAAEKGQVVALVKLGAIYEAGVLTRKNDRRAAEYYRKAIALDRADAMVSLGRALATRRLKGQGSRAEGVALLEQAKTRGNDNAVIVLSDAYFNGDGVKRSSARALALLTEAWAAGNVKAATRLVALYRDGRRGSVAPDLQRARNLLRDAAPKLEQRALEDENLLLAAKDASTQARRQAISDAFRQAPAAERAALSRRVRSADQNVYIYLVQEELKRAGLLRGKPSGQLSSATVRAIYHNCLKYEISDVCRLGPLSPRVVDATSLLFLG